MLYDVLIGFDCRRQSDDVYVFVYAVNGREQLIRDMERRETEAVSAQDTHKPRVARACHDVR